VFAFVLGQNLQAPATLFGVTRIHAERRVVIQGNICTMGGEEIGERELGLHKDSGNGWQ
jgi:hypothetical protein